MGSELARGSGAEVLERVIVQGDLAQLTPAERVMYYRQVCKSLGLNPLNRPFEYIVLKKLVLIYLTDLRLYQPWVHVRDAARALGLRPSRVLAILHLLHGKGFIRLGMEDRDQRQWFSINWGRLGVWIGGWQCGGGAVQ